MHIPSVAFICLCLALAGLTAGRAEEAVYPEGSSSIIETRSWQLSAADPLALHAQARTAVAQMDGVVVVKDEDGLLVVSLPTPLAVRAAGQAGRARSPPHRSRIPRPSGADYAAAPTLSGRVRPILTLVSV